MLTHGAFLPPGRGRFVLPVLEFEQRHGDLSRDGDADDVVLHILDVADAAVCSVGLGVTPLCVAPPDVMLSSSLPVPIQ